MRQFGGTALFVYLLIRTTLFGTLSRIVFCDVAVAEGKAEGIVVRALQDRAAAVERSCRKLRRVNDGNEKGKDGEPASQKSWPVWVCFI